MTNRHYALRAGTIAIAVLAPLVGAFVGLAIGFLIGGYASGWHPDVGGALGIGVLCFVLGAAGLAFGLWVSGKLLDVPFGWKAGPKAMDR